jgi:NitT/TauT family transport system ATP-binding protein
MDLAEAGPDGAAAAVSIRGVGKVFGHGANGVVALDGVSLDVRPGEFVCLLGASGCGKSTLLNLVAALDEPTSGTVEVRAGRTALMFQEAALFPWLTVRGNVELALKLSGVPRGLRRARCAQLLDMVHLGDFAKKRPHELSGGMRQRTALARALAQDAEILLMDEPFGALDAMTRDVLHDELESLWKETKAEPTQEAEPESTRGVGTSKTVLFVTHNVREAIRLGDRVVLLTSRPGRVAEIVTVDIARPRRIDSTEVATLAASITDQLREERERHARGH